MSDIQLFSNPEFGNIRAIANGDEIWFLAKDPCEMLGTRTNNLRSILDEDEISTLSQVRANDGTIDIGPDQGGRDPLVISESGFYHLILASRKPEAKAIRRWVTDEVLRSIRKHGVYATPEAAERLMDDPDFMIKTFTALKEERERCAELEAENAALAPKALFADAVEASGTCILVGDLAKLLSQNGVDIGQNRLFEWLRANGYLMKAGGSKNMPTQRSMDMGLFQVKERTFQNPDGSVRVTKTTKVTGKGQRYFINMFLGGEAA